MNIEQIVLVIIAVIIIVICATHYYEVSSTCDGQIVRATIGFTCIER